MVFIALRTEKLAPSKLFSKTGAFCQTLTQIAAGHDRTNDLLVPEVRAESASADWQPKHRFKLSAEQPANKNLLRLWVDDAHRFVVTSKTGYRKQSVVDVVRAAAMFMPSAQENEGVESLAKFTCREIQLEDSSSV